MSRGKLGIGFLGCGRIADLQCLGYLDNPRAEIVAVCDRSRETAERRREQNEAAFDELRARYEVRMPEASAAGLP